MTITKLTKLNKLIQESVEKAGPYIVEISSIEELFEMSSMAGAGMQFAPKPSKKKNNKRKKKVRKDIQTEMMLRKYIRKKATEVFEGRKKEEVLQELALRKVIRELLMEGDVSDVHPHRSTGINVLEDVLKKSIPTLRADFKRLTTDKTQRESFRAHIIKAIEDQLKPSLVNDQYPLNEPTPSPNKPEEGELLDEPGAEAGPEAGLAPPEESGPEDAAFADDLAALDEVEIEVDDEENKKLDIEDDEGPTEEEEFGSGLEGLDETGRNMAYTSFRKVSQYILDAYDSLANMEDKEIFVDYLITNLKLYFDKFEDELKKMVDEPTTDAYEGTVEPEGEAGI